MNLTDVATILIACAALPSLIFPPYYAWKSRGAWRHSDMGRHLMATTIVIALFLSLALTVRLRGRYDGFEYVAVVLYGTLAWLMGRRLFMLHRSPREAPTPKK